MAKHLPVGSAPVRQLIRDMYRTPERVEEEVERLVRDLRVG